MVGESTPRLRGYPWKKGTSLSLSLAKLNCGARDHRFSFHTKHAHAKAKSRSFLLQMGTTVTQLTCTTNHYQAPIKREEIITGTSHPLSDQPMTTCRGISLGGPSWASHTSGTCAPCAAAAPWPTLSDPRPVACPDV